MALLGNLLIAFAKVISMVISAYTFIVLGSVILSWVQPDPYNPIVRFLRMATEPLFRRVRRFMPAALFRSGIDFTPMLVILLLVFIETMLTQTLMDWGISLRQGSFSTPMMGNDLDKNFGL